jgi:iron complex transport system ATP-binding protein
VVRAAKKTIINDASSPAALRFQNVEFSRGRRLILGGINWELHAGGWGAIIGPNGSGKSTLVRLALGYLWPTRGEVSVLGCRLGEYPVQDIRRRVSIVEALSVYPFDENITAAEVVCTGFFGSLTLACHQPKKSQQNHVRQLLADMKLEHLADQLFWTLSTGERMRVLIARALVHQPDLLLLDECTSGLDLPTRETVLTTLESLHRTPSPPALVMVTHHLEELLPRIQNVLLLNRAGKCVAQGIPSKILTDRNMSQAFDWAIHVSHRGGRYHAQAESQIWPGVLQGI